MLDKCVRSSSIKYVSKTISSVKTNFAPLSDVIKFNEPKCYLMYILMLCSNVLLCIKAQAVAVTLIPQPSRFVQYTNGVYCVRSNKQFSRQEHIFRKTVSKAWIIRSDYLYLFWNIICTISLRYISPSASWPGPHTQCVVDVVGCFV